MNTDNSATEYQLNIPDNKTNRKISIYWFLLAITSMVIAGLFTILVVLSRVPFTQSFFPWIDFFHTALVVHVDLTVLTWFLSFAGLFWSLNSASKCFQCGWMAVFLAILGTMIIVVSPFFGAGMPLMNNYVPVLQHPLFFSGLIIFALGFALLVFRGLFYSQSIGANINAPEVVSFALYTGLISAFIALLSFIFSWFGITDNLHGQAYFEFLFWGAGHTIQFVHVQLVAVVWICLATAIGVKIKVRPKLLLFIFSMGLVPVLLTPIVYLLFDVVSAEHIQSITWLMRWGGGLVALPIAMIIVYSVSTSQKQFPKSSAERNALIFSFILFAAGGLIGYAIKGSNTIIPAHYHGSITAITLALMGISYHLLPRLGFAKPTGRLVNWQPIIYGIGQLIHIFGLAWSGGHGVQRKTAGAAQQLDSMEKVLGMRLVGLGGGIAIIAGIIFLVIVYKSLTHKKTYS